MTATSFLRPPATAVGVSRQTPLPAGTRLVHIGPPKTGTTSLQRAFHRARRELLEQGVRYAGRSHHSRRTILAAIGRPALAHRRKPPPYERWLKLLEEIRTAPESRVVLSSEILTDCRPELIRRVVADLGSERVHVAVTLRPLPSILASQWQQFIKGGLALSYDEWLRSVFEAGDRGARAFWYRHRHDHLVARWAEAVGPGNMTVIVVDELDQGALLRAFERLLGLRPGTLPGTDRANRSMTRPEAEAVLAFNVVAARFRLDPRIRFRFSRFVRWVVTDPEPPAGEAKIETPAWAVERAAGIAGEIADAIAGSGVQVMGDLDSLARPPDHVPVTGAPVVSRPRSAAGHLWLLLATMVRRGSRKLVRRARSSLSRGRAAGR